MQIIFVELKSMFTKNKFKHLIIRNIKKQKQENISKKHFLYLFPFEYKYNYNQK